MRGHFLFDGRSSRDFGLIVSGEQTFNAPERDVETVEIPGRDGELTIGRGRFKPVTVSYPVFIRSGFRERAAAVRAWLMGADGFRRLEDSYHPDEYRLARFAGPLDFTMRFLNYSGEASLAFTCQPQRWRKDGEFPLPCQNGGSLYNGGFPARPLIKVSGTGAGTLSVGGVAVSLLSLDGYVMLDCDTQNAYQGTVNKNGTISAPEFPVLQPGENVVSWTGGVTSVEITPRWWTV